MALHHINGEGTDNRLENLQLLCPNCHSQTPNFSGRNVRKRSAAACDAILERLGAVPLSEVRMYRLPVLRLTA